MSEKQKSQLVIINMSPIDSSLQIIIPPFRPVSLYELEDSYEEICEEITENIPEELADSIIDFITAFKETLDGEDVLPLLEYFNRDNVQNIDMSEMQQIFASLREYMNDEENRILHMH